MKHTRIFLLVAVVFVLALTMLACTPEHQHTWVEADCNTPKTCSECSATEGDALGHAIEELAGKPATCTEAGLTDGTKCSVCGEIVVAQTEIDKLPHTEEVIPGNPATCTEAGISDGKKCSVCDTVLAEQKELSATGHNHEIKAVVESTCTTAGKTVYQCSCGDSYEEALELADHNYSSAVTAPTCTAEGYTTYTCSCGDSYVADKVVALGHNYSSVVTPPTCTAEGYTTYTCSCGDSYVADYVAGGHTDEVVAGKAPTCTETGLTEGKKCSVCGVVTLAQELIPSNGHTDDNSDFECDVCHADLCTEHVASGALVENKVDADCTNAGSYDSVVKCTQCGEELSRETVIIPAIGHNEENVPGKSATCTETGLTDGKKCTVCGVVTLAQQEISSKGHSYSTTYVWSDDNSTCTATRACANDASHVDTETATVSVVSLTVSNVSVSYKFQVEFVSDLFEAQTKSDLKAVVLENNIATINAPAIAGRVASHDYVKFGFQDESASYNFDIYYSEVDVWDGESVSDGLQGSGTAEDPFLIQSAADFAYFAGVINAVEGEAGVNYKVATFQGKYFKMTKSIDLNGYALIVGAHSGWNNYQGFFGTLDGNNCTIRGININNNTLSSSALFGCIAKGGSVKNLSTYGTINGRVRLGGLAGYLLGSVDNITSYVTLNQTGTGNETGTVGGIVANQENSSGAITNCVNYGTITGQSYIFGGIVGSGGAAIEYCTNWGNVTTENVSIGGISGSTKDKGTITGCVNYGTISSTSTVYGKVGGIVGSCVKPINNCVNYGDINALHTSGGIAGEATKEITGCANYGKVIGTSCTSNNLNQITSSNVTKTDCVENGSVVIVEHKLAHVDAKAATCENAGNIAYDYCSVCNKNYDADGKELASVEIAAIGHAWSEGVVANGKITFTCQNDASHVRVEDAIYTVTVNYVFLNGSVAAPADEFEVGYNEIYTVNAKEINGYVASHDFVKLHVLGDESVTIYYSEVDVLTSDTVASTSLSGAGTAADPYLIQSAADLLYFANTITNHNVDGTYTNDASYANIIYVFEGKYFKLTKSIDLGNTNFVIGYYSSWNNYCGFAGILDGNNCSIRGLATNQKLGALFAAVAKGTVKNLSVYGTATSTAGYVSGVSTHLLKNGTLDNVTNYVNINSTGGDYVGGIVCTLESNGGTITNCVNYGNIVSNKKYVGGIAGCARATITNCTNWGNITATEKSGGIFGFSDKTALSVKNCTNYGTITGTTSMTYIGGIYGYLSTVTTDKIINCVDKSSLVD